MKDVEARRPVVIGGMTHISGPLSRIYADLRRKRMCYNNADEQLKAAETKYVNAVVERFDYSEEHAWAWLSMWYDCYLKTNPDACCLDILVAMSDVTEKLCI